MGTTYLFVREIVGGAQREEGGREKHERKEEDLGSIRNML